MQTIWLKSLLATSLAAAMLLGAVPGAIAQDKEKEKEKKIEKEFLESEVTVPTQYKLLIDRKEMNEE